MVSNKSYSLYPCQARKSKISAWRNGQNFTAYEIWHLRLEITYVNNFDEVYDVICFPGNPWSYNCTPHAKILQETYEFRVVTKWRMRSFKPVINTFLKWKTFSFETTVHASHKKICRLLIPAPNLIINRSINHLTRSVIYWN